MYLQYFRFGKMLALSHQHGLAQHTITMVAALSMQEVLLETPIGNNLVFSPNFSILVFFSANGGIFLKNIYFYR